MTSALACNVTVGAQATILADNGATISAPPNALLTFALAAPPGSLKQWSVQASVAGVPIGSSTQAPANAPTIRMPYAPGLVSVVVSDQSGNPTGPLPSVAFSVLAGIPGGRVAGAAALVIGAGQTAALAPDTASVEFNTSTSGGTATMVAPAVVGQRWVFVWLTGTTAPTITAPPGLMMQDYADPSTFVSTTSIITPGDSYEVEYDGTQLIRVA